MTPLERIWNGWRGDYVVAAGSHRADDGASVFTQILRSGMPDEECYVIHRSQHVFALLNAFPYISGHLMVVPYRQIPTVEDLTPEEHADLWSAVTDAVRAVKAAYRPGGVNIGVNLAHDLLLDPTGGVVTVDGRMIEHLHVHVLPRWSGDGNFMTSVANARTLPEALEVSAAKLRAAWSGCATI